MPEILIRVLSISLKGKRKKGKMIKIEVHQLIPINLLDKTKAEENEWTEVLNRERSLSLTELCEVYQAAKVYRQYNKIHFKNENHPKPHYALFCDKYVTKFENTYWTHVYQILDDNSLLSSKSRGGQTRWIGRSTQGTWT